MGPSSFVFSPDKEAEHGILCFVNSENPGFSGVLKQRYTDFLVNEIMPDGTIAHLTDDRAPSDISRDQVKQVSPEGDNSPKIDKPAVSGDNGGTTDASTVTDTVMVDAPTVPDTSAAVDPSTAPISSAVSDTHSTVPPEPQDTKYTFTISPEDDAVLITYFGEDLRNDVIALYKRILEKPDAKPSAFGQLFTNSIPDRAFRGKLHLDVRRIFKSHLETESIDDGVIKITAASLASRRPQNNKSGSRSSGGRARGGSSARNQMKGKLGWQELGGEYLHFSLYKENKDTMEVISFLCSALKIKPRDFTFAGTKDRRAVTVQRVSVFRQHAETLAELNHKLRGARLGDFKYEKSGLELGELRGNQFHITLRDCHFEAETGLEEKHRVELAKKVVGDAVNHLRAHGFINYFGLQRFGSFDITTDQVGKLILKGDFQGAVSAILSVSEQALSAALSGDTSLNHNIGREDVLRAHAIHLFKTTGKSDVALQKLPRRFSAETAIIRYLGSSKTKNDFMGAILKIPRNLRTMYVHAYQSLVWNTVTSQRWMKYGDRVIKGDLVFVESPDQPNIQDEVDESGEIVVRPAVDDSAISQADLFQRARPLTEEEAQSGKWTIFDVVLPTPGFDINYPDNDIGDYYKEVMSTERFGCLDPADMRRHQKDFSLSGAYRNILAVVGADMSFEIRVYHDENEQLVDTDLEKLRKANPDRYPHQTFDKETGRFENSVHRQLAETRKYIGTPQHNAWVNLPAKLAAEDKAAAEIADKQRELDLQDPKGSTDIKQPCFKETFIETNVVDNEGKRTGHRSTTLINSPKGSETSGIEVSSPKGQKFTDDKSVDAKSEVTGTTGHGHTAAEAPIEPLPQPAKIAVIVKFSLGPSQYATMALRELMKSGNVKTFKPEFSSGR
ncbi:putative Multisubstrate pseudouridine synthase 7 [Xylogone sp. PMI_703]|nr:putative Multisubstrate pseudouridine synthase 7 [Xylogone sp. PMI_703]